MLTVNFPIKPMDHVYRITDDNKILDLKVWSIEYHMYPDFSESFVNCRYRASDGYIHPACFSLDAIGKTVFLTEKEAKIHLKEKNHD